MINHKRACLTLWIIIIITSIITGDKGWKGTERKLLAFLIRSSEEIRYLDNSSIDILHLKKCFHHDYYNKTTRTILTLNKYYKQTNKRYTVTNIIILYLTTQQSIHYNEHVQYYLLTNKHNILLNNYSNKQINKTYCYYTNNNKYNYTKQLNKVFFSMTWWHSKYNTNNIHIYYAEYSG